MSEFKDWFDSIPFFTRYWLTFTIVVSLVGRFGIINYYNLVLDYYPFVHRFQILMDPMVLSVLYVWCQLNKEVIVSFWFGTRFKAMYLPWVLLGFNMIISGGGMMELLGILIGHLAFFLLFKYPQEFGGPALLTPPPFLKRLFPDTRYMGGFGAAPQTRVAPGNVFGRHNWGRGQALGGN
ncbi:Derlin-1 [Eumeta japonica]|uniref:Derlin n=1 Tax=Eumeta variegata TaxID=151549 RepID=A0A4C1XJJ4_EUMVA|nr:Derlin-1 [Eumeta japonica]